MSGAAPCELLPLAPGDARDPGDTGEMGAMTYPAYRHLLSLEPQARHPELGEVRLVQPFGFRAVTGGRTVGLALAEGPQAGDPAREAQLLSVYVRPEDRGRGIGASLVAAVEGAARGLGLTEVGAVYTTGKPGIRWMERILARRGWERPVPASLVVRFAPHKGLESPAFGPALPRFQQGLEVFPWHQLTAAQEAEMQRSNQERRWIEPALEPWKFDRLQLDSSSVGALHEGRVVGWVLNHRVMPGAVRFSASFMHADLARQGKIVALYHASLERLAADEACSECTFTTPFSYPRMIAFARRAIAPIAFSVEESRQVRILLASRSDRSE